MMKNRKCAVDIGGLVDDSWREIVEDSLSLLDSEYLRFIQKNEGYFPDLYNFLNAFKTLSLENVRFILFGQDPYPRKQSAIGYAFIDAKVKELFSENGFSKEVNKATSLRNFLKTLMLVDGRLEKDDLSQAAIAQADKNGYINSICQLRENFEKNGVLLLNMALIFTKKEESNRHIKEWRAFIQRLLDALKKRDIKLILFGKAAQHLKKYESSYAFGMHILPHPYNLSFIYNEEAHKLFGNMKLLVKNH